MRRIATRLGLGRVAVVVGAWMFADLVMPATAMAADCPCPSPSIAESPAGPAVLMTCAAVSIGLLGYLRRRRRLATTVVVTIGLVLVVGAVLTMMLAAAATTCTCVSAVGGVLGTSTIATGTAAAVADSPLTGADIPWITATILIIGGSVASLIALFRHRPEGQ